MPFRAFLSDAAATPSTDQQRVPLDELSLRPCTARILAIAILARISAHRTAVKKTSDPNTKIDALADLIADTAYLSALQIAVDQNDPALIRQIPRR